MYKVILILDMFLNKTPPQKKLTLKIPALLGLKNNQELSIHVKSKHANKYVKEIKTNPSGKTLLKKAKQQDILKLKRRMKSW